MAAPPVSHPLEYLKVQMQSDLDAAGQMCLQIQNDEKATTTKHELALLHADLAAGSTFVANQFRNIASAGTEGVDTDGGDEGLRQALTASMHRISTIRTSLSRFTYPEKVHHDNMHKHDHHHHHHHHNQGYLLIDSIFGPYVNLSVHTDNPYHLSDSDHHHRDTVFHRSLMEWRSVQNAIIQAVEDFRIRIQKKAADKQKETNDKKKIEEEKQKAVKEERKKWVKIVKDKEAEKQKLEKKVKKEEKHKDTMLKKEETRKEKLQEEVNKAGINQLNQDPFEGMEKVGKIMSKIRKDVCPRPSNPGNANAGQISEDSSDEELWWWCNTCNGWYSSHHRYRHIGDNKRAPGHGHHSHQHRLPGPAQMPMPPALLPASSQQPTVLNQIQLDVTEDAHMSTPAVKTTSNPDKATATVNTTSSHSHSSPLFDISISEAGTSIASPSSSASSSTVDLTTIGVDPPRIGHLTYHHDDQGHHHNNHHHHHGHHDHHHGHHATFSMPK